MPRAYFLLLISLSASLALQFSATGAFKIVQFTDHHFGSDYASDNETVLLEQRIIEIEQPDLVVLTGDVVSGGSYQKKGCCMEGGIPRCWEAAVSPMVKLKVPWATTLGNHDAEGDLTRPELIKLDQSFGALTGSFDGAHTTFSLPVTTHNGSTVRARLWFFDSESYNCLGVKGYGCVDAKQIAWYHAQSLSLKSQQRQRAAAAAARRGGASGGASGGARGGARRGARGGEGQFGIAFFHIPLEEMMFAYNEQTCYGDRAEQVCCSSVNTGLYAAFLEHQNVQWTSSGHDHESNYHCAYHGITLAYGQHSGYAGKSTWPRGARVFLLTLNQQQSADSDSDNHHPLSDVVTSVKTWIRLDDGRIHPLPEHKKPPLPVQAECCAKD